jgi:anti-sigma regulatory factor (Ser/Thr protein kinase)
MEQELRVARLIQQTLLPRELPNLPNWTVAAHYQPVRAVGGDFYDFIYFADGRVGFIIGDVTDKGVPAALVMATTRAILRGAAQSLSSPGEILERANELLCPDIPPNMFVTCLYAILDQATGRLQYANAGHDLPYHRHAEGVTEMRATGMPLGCMPDMHYEEREVILEAGDSVLLHSDGLVEAHNPRREMFGFPRLSDLMRQHPGGAALIPFLLEQLAAFTGPGWEQEDDLTFVTLQRASRLTPGEGDEAWRTLTEFEWPSERGSERQAMEKVAEAVRAVDLPPARLERLKTAVTEATMNAMEHGNKFRREMPVYFTVRASENALSVSITDHGGQPMPKAQTPDLDAKLAGTQTPRGWGLFLIEKMVDELRVTTNESKHTVELVLNLKGDAHGH